MATTLAEILAWSGQDPKTSGIDPRTLYTPVHATPTGEILKGKDAIRATQSAKLAASASQMSSPVAAASAAAYKLRMVCDVEHWLSKFITQDDAMCKMKDVVRKLCNLSYPVLIHGETGTGKELIAKALHDKRTGSFVDLNCGGFPEHLIESELFGHVAGAFTGADKDKQGLFQAASCGTLFLDEIGELPMLMQCKLLRALQENVVRRVGSVNNEQVNCRIVAASHCNLGELVKAGKFREDLLWRLNTFEITLSPLRERTGDIPLISRSLGLELLPHECGIPVASPYDTLTIEQIHAVGLAVHHIKQTSLSGNVRQLQQIVLRKKYLGN